MKSVWAKLGEARGRSIFCPFDSEEMADHAFALSWDLKLSRAKAVLQDVARLVQVPDIVIDRPKSGFGVQPRQLSARAGILEPFVPIAAKVFEVQTLREMQESDDRKVAHTFWNVVNYAIWKRTAIDGDPVEALVEELENPRAPISHAPSP
jgi:hypothetical protein